MQKHITGDSIGSAKEESGCSEAPQVAGQALSEEKEEFNTNQEEGYDNLPSILWAERVIDINLNKTGCGMYHK